MYISVVVLGKKTGAMIRKLAAGIALRDLEIEPDQIVSWETTIYSPGSGFDWKNRVLKFGTATAYMVATSGGETKQIPNVGIRIEGDPVDVGYLIEEITRILDGEVINCTPQPLSAWRKFVSWWKTIQAEMESA